jgi:Fic family protein
MTWNWQLDDWPEFRWDRALLRKAEEAFLIGSGMVVGEIKHLDAADQEYLTVDAMSTEALTTSAIEGEILDRASVQSSIRRQLGLTADNRRIKPAEQGVSEMMTSLYRSFAEPLSEEMLFAWHRELLKGRSGLRYVGRYREDDEPMQVVSGALHSPIVHFEAPPSSKVPKEMVRFIQCFNRTAPDGSQALPALTRAGIAHLYFESIHPFEDGNGRIGRAISQKALAQSVGHLTLTALAETILIRRKSYYSALEEANKSNEISKWLAWFAGIAIEAQRRTAARVEFLIAKTKLLDRLRGELNERQEKALLRLLREGPQGFKGGLSASNYIKITGASPATTTRDLTDLIDKGALKRTGERRHARYHLTIPLTPIAPVALDRNGEWR